MSFARNAFEREMKNASQKAKELDAVCYVYFSDGIFESSSDPFYPGKTVGRVYPGGRADQLILSSDLEELEVRA